MVGSSSRVPTSCRVCQSNVPAGQRFCGTCGTPVLVDMPSDGPASDSSVLPAASGTPSTQPASDSSVLPATSGAPSTQPASDQWASPSDPTGARFVGDEAVSSPWPGVGDNSYSGAASPNSMTSPYPGTSAYPAATSTEPYPSAVVAAGVIASFFMPLISLVVALVLGSSESNPAKKGQLRTWATLSAAVMLVGLLLVLGLLAAGTTSRL